MPAMSPLTMELKLEVGDLQSRWQERNPLSHHPWCGGRIKAEHQMQALSWGRGILNTKLQPPHIYWTLANYPLVVSIKSNLKIKVCFFFLSQGSQTDCITWQVLLPLPSILCGQRKESRHAEQNVKSREIVKIT